MIAKLEIYTDGAYSPTRDQGGVGLVFIRDGTKIYEWSKSIKIPLTIVVNYMQ